MFLDVGVAVGRGHHWTLHRRRFWDASGRWSSLEGRHLLSNT